MVIALIRKILKSILNNVSKLGCVKTHHVLTIYNSIFINKNNLLTHVGLRVGLITVAYLGEGRWGQVPPGAKGWGRQNED